MRKLMILAALPLWMAGCAGANLPNLPPSPGHVADSTTLDEQGAIGVELAYKAFRTALEVATDAGLIRGATATKVAVLDARAFAAVGAVRGAYNASNALTYGIALAEAKATILAALAAIKGQ